MRKQSIPTRIKLNNNLVFLRSYVMLTDYKALDDGGDSTVRMHFQLYGRDCVADIWSKQVMPGYKSFEVDAPGAIADKFITHIEAHWEEVKRIFFQTFPDSMRPVLTPKSDEQ